MRRADRVRALRGLLGAVALAGVACAGDGGPRIQPPVGVPVLIYHEIRREGGEAGETVMSLERFREQMQYLAEHGYTPISITDLVGYMQGRPLDARRPVVLTFDDGWKNALDAIPVLDQRDFAASFWIITHKGIGEPYVDWSDVHALAANPRFEIGSHTATHPWDPWENLVTWSDGRVPGKGLAEIRFELEASRRELEQRLGYPVYALAWPCGWYNEALVAQAREAGYDVILTADDGLNRPGDDLLHIKRVMVDGLCDLASFERLLHDGIYRPCQTAGRITEGHSPYPYQ